MARGMIYEIENNPADLGYMDIEDFYENYPACDGMQTVDGNDALQRVGKWHRAYLSRPTQYACCRHRK